MSNELGSTTGNHILVLYLILMVHFHENIKFSVNIKQIRAIKYNRRPLLPFCRLGKVNVVHNVQLTLKFVESRCTPYRDSLESP